MTYTPNKTLTIADFLTQYQNTPRYELADGELIDMEPTEPHETVSGKIGIAIAQQPWFIPRNCLIRPFIDRPSPRYYRFR
jgi:Uma2 family endonuclease